MSRFHYALLILILLAFTGLGAIITMLDVLKEIKASPIYKCCSSQACLKQQHHGILMMEAPSRTQAGEAECTIDGNSWFPARADGTCYLVDAPSVRRP